MFGRPRMLIAVVLLGPVAGCGGEREAPSAHASISDSAGVRVVGNPGQDRRHGRSPVELSRLVPPDSALVAMPWGVDADPEAGRIYALDRSSPRVVVFGRDGEYLETLGREGGGPGEFRNPSALTVRDDGTLLVWDTGRGVLSRWSPAGELAGERPVPPVSYWGPGVHVTDGRLVTVTSRKTRSARRQILVEVPVGDTASAGADTAVLHTVAQGMATVSLPCMQGPMPRVLEPTLAWTATGESVYAVNGPGYRIDVFRGGRRTASIRRPEVDPVEVTPEMAAERARLQFRGFLRRCGISAEQLVEEVGHAERITPIRWLTVDPAGRLWVARGEGHLAAERIDVLSADGRYRGTVDAAAMPLAFVSGSRFVGLTIREETGATVLSLYELRATSGSGESRSRPEGSRAGPGRPAWSPPVREDLREFRDCPECPLMVELPPGSFTMGAPEGEAPAAEIPTRPQKTERRERPQVEVTIDYRLAVGKYEVTFEEWDACVEAGGCEHRPDDEGWGRGDRPVIHVSRSDARQYVAWLSRRTGESYRLPSEAEWEYAARAGTETARWWGDELGEGRVPCDGCGTRWDRRSTAPVGSFPANPWGLHDMLTNVEEWVADCWHETHEGNPGDGSARVESSPWWREGGWEERRGEPCRRPVERGGTNWSYPWTIRAAARSFYFPHPNWTERKDRSQGFRVVRAVEGPERRPGRRGSARRP